MNFERAAYVVRSHRPAHGQDDAAWRILCFKMRVPTPQAKDMGSSCSVSRLACARQPEEDSSSEERCENGAGLVQSKLRT